ncbi:hypothetical protein F5X98DRAFT_359635 [Xylaria grammica]|nr:hypothetical protein F5X98DRAFT_359635 [Xylaria grammica]
MAWPWHLSSAAGSTERPRHWTSGRFIHHPFFFLLLSWCLYCAVSSPVASGLRAWVKACLPGTWPHSYLGTRAMQHGVPVPTAQSANPPITQVPKALHYVRRRFERSGIQHHAGISSDRIMAAWLGRLGTYASLSIILSRPDSDETIGLRDLG